MRQDLRGNARTKIESSFQSMHAVAASVVDGVNPLRVLASDVARRAGVSQSTVSRVLNGFPHVKEATRERVLRAVRELQYQPDEVARSMATARTYSLGLVLANITNPFYAEVAQAIVDEARYKGYQVILYHTSDDPGVQKESIDTLLRRRVDGILIASARWNDPDVARLLDRGYALVLLNRRTQHEGVSWVLLNNQLGGYLATEHLVHLGHRRIGYIGGPTEISTARERFAGYKDALLHHDIPLDERIICTGTFGASHASTAVRDMLLARPIPTAIFAANDLLALAAMEALLERGYRIPEDISLVGFDDIDIAGHRAIQLTTVTQRKGEMGRKAVEILLNQLEHPADAPKHVYLQPELIVRRTSGPPPVRRLDAAYGQS